MLFLLFLLKPTHLVPSSEKKKKTDITFHTHLYLNTLAAEDVVEAEEVAGVEDVAVDAEAVAVDAAAV